MTGLSNPRVQFLRKLSLLGALLICTPAALKISGPAPERTDTSNSTTATTQDDEFFSLLLSNANDPPTFRESLTDFRDLRDHSFAREVWFVAAFPDRSGSPGDERVVVASGHLLAVWLKADQSARRFGGSPNPSRWRGDGPRVRVHDLARASDDRSPSRFVEDDPLPFLISTETRRFFSDPKIVQVVPRDEPSPRNLAKAGKAQAQIPRSRQSPVVARIAWVERRVYKCLGPIQMPKEWDCTEEVGLERTVLGIHAMLTSKSVASYLAEWFNGIMEGGSSGSASDHGGAWEIPLSAVGRMRGRDIAEDPSSKTEHHSSSDDGSWDEIPLSGRSRRGEAPLSSRRGEAPPSRNCSRDRDEDQQSQQERLRMLANARRSNTMQEEEDYEQDPAPPAFSEESAVVSFGEKILSSLASCADFLGLFGTDPVAMPLEERLIVGVMEQMRPWTQGAAGGTPLKEDEEQQPETVEDETTTTSPGAGGSVSSGTPAPGVVPTRTTSGPHPIPRREEDAEASPSDSPPPRFDFPDINAEEAASLPATFWKDFAWRVPAFGPPPPLPLERERDHDEADHAVTLASVSEAEFATRQAPKLRKSPPPRSRPTRNGNDEFSYFFEDAAFSSLHALLFYAHCSICVFFLSLSLLLHSVLLLQEQLWGLFVDYVLLDFLIPTVLYGSLLFGTVLEAMLPGYWDLAGDTAVGGRVSGIQQVDREIQEWEAFLHPYRAPAPIPFGELKTIAVELAIGNADGGRVVTLITEAEGSCSRITCMSSSCLIRRTTCGCCGCLDHNRSVDVWIASSGAVASRAPA